jgi:thymidylate kinase
MKIIEFLGMARAGKTTQLNLLQKYLEAKGYRVVVLTDRERGESLHTPPSESLAYLLTFFSAVIEFVFEHKDRADYLLIDRGFADVAVWADVHVAIGNMTPEECEAVKVSFARFAEMVDKTFFFDVPVDVALERHEQGKEHQTVDDLAMNRKWLDVLADAYAKHASSFPNLVRIDGLQNADMTEQQLQTLLI